MNFGIVLNKTLLVKTSYSNFRYLDILLQNLKKICERYRGMQKNIYVIFHNFFETLWKIDQTVKYVAEFML
jgi:hypothetical protein